MELRDWIGNIDIYLLDQIVKGRFVPGSRILDAGCGDADSSHGSIARELYGTDKDGFGSSAEKHDELGFEKNGMIKDGKGGPTDGTRKTVEYQCGREFLRNNRLHRLRSMPAACTRYLF